ncbi:MAG: hypothetical protein JW904_05930 [Spirochaetales bacterium]|nr:hypothetical protein [Spirochaetales bacterium]
MAEDKRDLVWEAVFETFYDSYYQEMEAESRCNFWQRFDTAAKFLAAATAGSSAVAGWAFWAQPPFQMLWTGIAGIAAVFTILQIVFATTAKVKDWNTVKTEFNALRIDCESLRTGMKIDSEFDVRKTLDKRTKLLEKYKKASAKIPPDVLLFRGLKVRIQKQLDLIIADQIIPGKMKEGAAV